MTKTLLAAALFCLTLAPVAGADITVNRVPATPGVPSPAARTCELRFRPNTPVVSSCKQSCYIETWDGPVLLAANTCSYPIWASFVFAAADGRTWRTTCYELEPGADAVAVPEATLEPMADRRVVIAQEPGTLGYVFASPMPACPTAREVQPSTAP